MRFDYVASENVEVCTFLKMFMFSISTVRLLFFRFLYVNSENKF